MKEAKQSTLFCSHYQFQVRYMADAPPGLYAMVNGESYRVVKIAWCTWYSSGEKEGFGSLIVINGDLHLAEKLSGFEGIKDYGNA